MRIVLTSQNNYGFSDFLFLPIAKLVFCPVSWLASCLSLVNNETAEYDYMF